MNLNGLKWCLNDFNWFIRHIESHLESYWVFWSHKSPEANKIVLVCNTHCDVQFWWGLIKEIQDCVYEKLCLAKLPRPPGVRRVIYVSSVKNRLKKMIKKVNVSLNCAFSIKYEHKFVVYIGAEDLLKWNLFCYRFRNTFILGMKWVNIHILMKFLAPWWNKLP